MKRLNIFDCYFITFVVIAIGMIGAFDAVKDTLTHHYSQSIFRDMDSQFWDASVSWCNKWSDCESGKERFPLSSSALVFLTDGWHLMKFFILRLSLVFPAIILWLIIEFENRLLDNFFVKFVIIYLCLGFIQSSVFHLFYHYVLLR